MPNLADIQYYNHRFTEGDQKRVSKNARKYLTIRLIIF